MDLGKPVRIIEVPLWKPVELPEEPGRPEREPAQVPETEPTPTEPIPA